MSDDISLTEAERTAGIVRCDACPVLCRIRPGRAGACIICNFGIGCAVQG